MKRIIGLVAVIGLTLTVVTGCGTSEESASTVASVAEAPEAASLKKDCAIIYNEFPQISLENNENTGKANRSVDNKIAAKIPRQDHERPKRSYEYTLPLSDAAKSAIAARDARIEAAKEIEKAFARIWPQMSDPDLKSICRSLADGWDDTLGEQSDWIAYMTICDV